MRKHNKPDRTKKFLVYFLGFIMVSSVFGVVFFGFQGSGPNVKYNDFKFFNRGSFWSTNVDGKEALFTYLPQDLESISADASAINILKNKPQIDMTSDFNDTFAEGIALAQYQAGITLSNFGIFTRTGFTGENKYDLPIISCKFSTQLIPVMYFKKSNTTRISLQNNCIIAESGNHADVIRLKDRIVYGILGIIG